MTRRPASRVETWAARVQAALVEMLAHAGHQLVLRGVAADRIDQRELSATGLGVSHALTVDGISVYEASVDAVLRTSGTYDFLRAGFWRLDGLARIGLPIDVAALEGQRLADAS